jgi:hypothetical protein
MADQVFSGVVALAPISYLLSHVNRRAGPRVQRAHEVDTRSGARVVEEAALEMLFTGNRNESSNLSRSAE